MRPSPGSKAPDFTLLTDTGETLTLSALEGHPVVLFFYPKDDTSGCTIEACEFRDQFPRFAQGNAVILGVSPDGVKSHAKFKAKFQLPYALLADTEKVVVNAYDVWKDQSFYGQYRVRVERTTFVIDANGRIAHVFEKVKPAGHAAEVQTVLDAL